MSAPHVVVFDSAESLCQAAARHLVDLVKTSPPTTTTTTGKHDGRWSIALSGGSTPKRLYTILREQHPDVATGRIEYFFGDVRMVPDDSPDSNFKMASESLLHVVDPVHVHAINTKQPAAAAAAEFEQTLRSRLAADAEGTPQFDLVLLGVGPDGHTASLFPGTPASQERERLVVTCMPNPGITPMVERVTITSRVIQAARHVLVLATGADKHWVLRGIVDDTPPAKVPVSRLVRDCAGAVTLMVDKAMTEGPKG